MNDDEKPPQPKDATEKAAWEAVKKVPSARAPVDGWDHTAPRTAEAQFHLVILLREAIDRLAGSTDTNSAATQKLVASSDNNSNTMTSLAHGLEAAIDRHTDKMAGLASTLNLLTAALVAATLLLAVTAGMQVWLSFRTPPVQINVPAPIVNVQPAITLPLPPTSIPHAVPAAPSPRRPK